MSGKLPPGGGAAPALEEPRSPGLAALRPRWGRELRGLYGPFRHPAPRSHGVPEDPPEPRRAQRSSEPWERRWGGGLGARAALRPASPSPRGRCLGEFRRDGADIVRPQISPRAAGGGGTAAFLRSWLCEAGTDGPARRVFLICAINRSGEAKRGCDKGRGKPAPQIPAFRPTSPPLPAHSGEFPSWQRGL